MKYSPELAKSYTEQKQEFSETDEKLFDRLEDVGVYGKNILDLGCGDGKHVRKISDMGAKSVVGVDVSAEMIKLAAGKSEGNDGVHFVVGDGAHVPLPDASRDVIVSNFVIHNLADSNAVFKEAARVLVPGGTMIATFNVTDVKPGSEHLLNTHMPIRLGSEEQPVIVQNLIKSPAEIAAAIERNGFAIVENTELDHPNAVVDTSYPHRDEIQKQARLFVLKKNA